MVVVVRERGLDVVVTEFCYSKEANGMSISNARTVVCVVYFKYVEQNPLAFKMVK